MTMTTVKLPVATQRRLRSQAAVAHKSQAAYLDFLLDEREKTMFWDALAASPNPTTAELDAVDEAFIATASDGDL
jgi:hypothetical protein